MASVPTLSIALQVVAHSPETQRAATPQVRVYVFMLLTDEFRPHVARSLD